jgi:hypothetical protein
MLKHTQKILLAAACCWVFALQAAPSHVARVSMAVGQAQRVDISGQSQPLLLGALLQEQDRIITGQDAMVILVFADQARVALRPDSELVIRSYKIDPTGENTRLQLDLLRGTVRQISGQAAHQQPERYRLNTPIAAIGVRGTDFLAKATETATEAYVHEGAIVVSPHGVLDLHTLANASALNAGDGVRYERAQSSSAPERRSVSQEDAEKFFGIRIAARQRPADVALADQASPGGQSGAPGVLSVQGKDTTNLALIASTQPLGDISSALPAVSEPSAPPPVVVAPPPVVVAPPPVVVAPPPVAVAPPEAIAPMPKQLAWGRFSNPQDLPLTLPLPFEQAREGRHVTVGELGQYALWRNGANGPIDKTLRGQTQFALAGGEGFYQPQGGNPVALSLSNPMLQVDFDRARFTTQLGLAGSGIASQQLSVSGRINDEGVFVGNSAGQRVAGALSRNGLEAGYLFNITNPAGTTQGITLWNAK